MFISISISAGIILLLASLVVCAKVIALISSRNLKMPWYVLFCLTCLFVLGYIAYLYLASTSIDITHIMHNIIGTVFFFGAVFVFVVMTVNYRLIKQINLHTKEIDEKNVSLTRVTQELSTHKEDLEKAKEQLEHKNQELEALLDDFYTARVGILKDLADGRIEIENQQIKKRLDMLKNLK